MLISLLIKPEVLARAGFHPPFDPSTMATSALFSTPQRTSNIVLIVQIVKALQGASLDHVLDTYFAPTSNAKATHRQRMDVELSLPVLGRFTQPFAFSVLPLFHPDGSLLSSAAGTPQQLYGYPKVCTIPNPSFIGLVFVLTSVKQIGRDER